MESTCHPLRGRWLRPSPNPAGATEKDFVYLNGCSFFVSPFGHFGSCPDLKACTGRLRVVDNLDRDRDRYTTDVEEMQVCSSDLGLLATGTGSGGGGTMRLLSRFRPKGTDGVATAAVRQLLTLPKLVGQWTVDAMLSSGMRESRQHVIKLPSVPVQPPALACAVR